MDFPVKLSTSTKESGSESSVLATSISLDVKKKNLELSFKTKNVKMSKRRIGITRRILQLDGKVLPRFELGSPDSKSEVLTITP